MSKRMLAETETSGCRSGSRMSKRLLAETSGAGGQWAEITKLASQPGMINLGQGFPDFACSAAASEGARTAIELAACNQYTPIPGSKRLCKALSSLYNCMYPTVGTSIRENGSKALNPDTELCITSGGSEAIFCAMQGLIDPGDEVVLFEPFFPLYLPAIRMAGGVIKSVRLPSPSFDVLSVSDEVRKAFSERTKLCVFNTPHNPTGHCASDAELRFLADLCQEFDVICISDEVYEACVFEGETHRRMCEVEGMWERTLTIGSASKMFSLTGWRVGWATGSEDLVGAVRAAHQHITFCAPAPLQDAVAAAMEAEALSPQFDGVAKRMHENWELLADAFRSIGVDVCPAQGGYFLVVDVTSTGMTDMEYFTWLASEHKVGGVPMSMFFSPQTNESRPCQFLRFAVCKERGYIERAAAAIRGASVEKAKVKLAGA